MAGRDFPLLERFHRPLLDTQHTEETSMQFNFAACEIRADRLGILVQLGQREWYWNRIERRLSRREPGSTWRRAPEMGVATGRNLVALAAAVRASLGSGLPMRSLPNQFPAP